MWLNEIDDPLWAVLGMDPLPYFLSPRWSQKLQADPAGLCLAREKGWLLAWDQSQWIYLLNQKGVVQGQVRSICPIAACCIADDASAAVVAGKDGQLNWLGPDLTSLWQQRRPHGLLAAALDPFALFVAAADSKGTVHIVDKEGNKKGEVQSPRPLQHITFVPTRPLLVGCADYGLAGAFDFQGNWTWREGIVSNMGGLSVNHDGSAVLVACFSDGAHRYSVDGKDPGRINTPEPCRFALQSFDGFKILAGGLGQQVFLLDRQGQVLCSQKLEHPFTALAFGPLGETVYAACPGPGIIHFKVKKKSTEMK